MRPFRFSTLEKTGNILYNTVGQENFNYDLC